MKITSFTDLDTWKKAHNLVLGIYEVTKHFPQEERFGLSLQMRRAAVSITSNIAEGFSRQSRKEKIQFYSIARGSLCELQSQLFIARDVKYMDSEKFETMMEQSVKVHKLIHGLIKNAPGRKIPNPIYT